MDHNRAGNQWLYWLVTNAAWFALAIAISQYGEVSRATVSTNNSTQETRR